MSLKKKHKLNSIHFSKYTHNWLAIYDNYSTVIFNNDIGILIKSLKLQFSDWWDSNSFDTLFIICNNSLIKMKKDSITSMNVIFC